MKYDEHCLKVIEWFEEFKESYIRIKQAVPLDSENEDETGKGAKDRKTKKTLSNLYRIAKTEGTEKALANRTLKMIKVYEKIFALLDSISFNDSHEEEEKKES